MSLSLFRYVGILALAALGACGDRLASDPPAPPPRPELSQATLQWSDSAPPRGAIVTLVASTSPPAGSVVGSYTARLRYDTLQLDVVAVDTLADGGLHAVNPQPGEYRLAGAAASGLPNGVLFRLRVRVRQPAGLQRVALLLDELHTTRLSDLTANLSVQDGRTALLGAPSAVAGASERRIP